jgi:hypothetical protein
MYSSSPYDVESLNKCTNATLKAKFSLETESERLLNTGQRMDTSRAYEWSRQTISGNPV